MTTNLTVSRDLSLSFLAAALAAACALPLAAQVAEQPAQVAEQPAQVAEQPAQVAEQPAQVAEQPASTRLSLGSTVPAAVADVKMVAANGDPVSIADVTGEKGTLVIFTCNHCPWVIRWDRRIADLGKSFAKAGIGVIAINPNDPAVQAEDGLEAMIERARSLDLAYPYVVDATSGVARAFGATRTPEVFLFDAKGHLVYHGAVDDNAREPEAVEVQFLRDALQAVVDGKEVEMKETRFLGCTIKWRGQA